MTDVDSAAPGPRPAGPATDDLTLPVLHGAHVALRPVTVDDYSWLQELDAGPRGIRWRSRGATFSPEQWAHSAWHSVLAQYVVSLRRDGQRIGLVVVYQPNFQHGFAYFAAAALQKHRSPFMMLGCALFFDYVFACWDFRKLYLELPEYNLGQFRAGVDRYFTVEGRLKAHSYLDGRYWDELLLALYRDEWATRGRRLIQLELTRPPKITGTRVRRA